MHEYALNPYFWFVACVGVLLTGISKSGFAGGVGVVAVPLLALVMPIPTAVALMLPLLLVMDAKTVAYYRKGIDWHHLKIILPTALLGIAIAGWGLNSLPSQGLQILLGLFSVVFALWRQLTPILGKIKGSGLIWGFLAGVASTLLHAGGPPMNVYLLTQQLPKIIWLATASVFFAVLNVVKIIPYTLNNQWSLSALQLDILLVPVAFVGVWLGRFIQGHISDAQFTSVCRVLLFISGAGLLIKALM